ncbi:peptidoglycan-associated lipoprotein Pal [Aliiglaciecola sp. LCG003]|uniref:peptidoglycan-associated lipoprotein Pal n=1 Tax=Aliiglaciecola sp. LCG003 TaxID=3053655 RepID=UPI002573C931|nr:peptidoglycan-associated lipoprotein Pal [Aliiglaciecola sp. LCG003]WJG08105.1 peptidoglycan-associated lipoprotein Pal [Aliiglaciecola sp. LCG003]
MQLKKLCRGLLIALPVLTMMACTSTDNKTLSEEEARAAAATQAEVERQARDAQQAAEAKVLEDRRMKLEEMRQNDLATLQQDQVVYFDFDTSNLSSAAYAVLEKHADYLAKNPSQSIVIEGHCDHRGTPEYNIALGERRAKSVQTYLMNSGVSASQMSVVSYGEEKPAVSGSSESAFAQNRRGILVYQ